MTGINSFHSIHLAHIMFTCTKCRRSLKVENTIAVPSGSLNNFITQFTADLNTKLRDQSVVETLTESFVVLPNNSNSSTATNAASSITNPAANIANATLASPSEKSKFLIGSFSPSTASNFPATKPQTSATNLDKQLQTLQQIFEIASGKVSMDFPCCTNCGDAINNELERKLAEASKDRDCYRDTLAKLVNTNAPSPANNTTEQSEKEFSQLEKQLQGKLQLVREERQALAYETAQLADELNELNDFEARFWCEYQDFQHELSAIQVEQAHLKQQIKYETELLERMKRTNVYDDSFHISYDGHFGTINGFRLGRLPAQPVDWIETNAALGQCCLLLHTIAKQANFKFTKYRLFPMGSFSKMSKLDDLTTHYELFGSNDITLSRLFWYRRFDTALTWLLACIKELADFAQITDNKFKLKYPIKNDMIGEVSIKLQFNNDAKWTKALKYMLTNLKFLLVWCSKTKKDGV
jgi:beclin 1